MSSQREQERQRGKRKENRHERREAQHSGGGNWDCITIPDGLEVFKPEKDKTYHIDVIPYIVGGHNKNADKGDEYFELSYPIYRNLGIDDKKYIAIGEFKGVKDPVAEHFAALRKAGTEWDDMKIFKPTWRQLMLIFVHEEADKGLQLFEGAYGTFGELLDEEIKGNEETWIDNFDDPDKGATLEVRFKAKSIGQTNPWILASKINFSERDDGFTADGDKKLAAEVLAKAAEICLDDILKIPDYDTLKKALDGEPMGKGDDDEDEKEAPADKGDRRGRKPAKEGDAEDDTEGEEPVKKKTPAKDEDDDEPAPKKGKAPPPEDEEEPPKKSKKATAESLGIAKGDTVVHDEHGKCTVLRIAEDGTTLSLVDKDDDIHKGVDVTDVEPVAAKKAKPSEEDDETEEDETPPKKSAPTASKLGATDKSASPSKDKKKDDDWDDDWDDDDKDAAPKKKK